MTGCPGPERWPLLASRTLTALPPIVVQALPMVHGTRVPGVLTLHQRGLHGRIDLDAAAAVSQMGGAASGVTAGAAGGERTNRSGGRS